MEIEQIPAIGLIKLSMIFFYTRVLGVGAPTWFKRLSWLMVGITIAWMVAFLFSWFFLCSPDPSVYWQSSAAELAHCVKTQVLHNSLAISDAVIDLIIVLMALPVVGLTWTCSCWIRAYLLGLEIEDESDEKVRGQRVFPARSCVSVMCLA